MRIGRAGTGHDEHLCAAERQRLRSQREAAVGCSEHCGEGPVAHHALEARNTRLVAFEFDDQRRGARGEFQAPEFGGFRGGALDHVGEADAVRRQELIMDRFEQLHAERLADVLAKY